LVCLVMRDKLGMLDRRARGLRLIA
jgi:hypothetical protein